MAFYQNKYQGVARHKSEKDIRVIGRDLDDAEVKLRNLIDYRTNSIEFEIGNFDCSVAPTGRDYLGKVKLNSKVVYRTNGKSIENTKEIIEKYLQENGQDLVYNFLREAHQASLAKNHIKNHESIGLSKSEGKINRVTYCYSCKKGLDNSIDYECNACGWILCICGACGCGYN